MSRDPRTELALAVRDLANLENGWDKEELEDLLTLAPEVNAIAAVRGRAKLLEAYLLEEASDPDPGDAA